MKILLILILMIASTAQAKVQEASSTVPIKPGDRIENLYPQQLKKDFILQRLTKNMYWVSSYGYNASFYVGKEGVLVFDPLAGGAGEHVLTAIKSVTDLPVTGMVYSHYHLDHIGDANIIYNSNKHMKIYASSTTTAHARTYGGVPIPTNTVKVPEGSFYFENLKVIMRTPPQGHTDDDAIIYIPSESFVHYVDMINPDQMPYLNFAGLQDFQAYQNNLKYLMTLDFKLMNAGHGNIGTKEDVLFVLHYIDELKTAIKGTYATIKPHTFHDPQYNHQRAALAYKKAVIEAIRPEFEKKYGHYYGFNEAFPVQVEVVIGDLELYNP